VKILLTFQDIYDFCITTFTQSPDGISNLTKQVSGGYIQVYSNPLNVECAISIDGFECPVLKLEYNSDTKRFNVNVADDSRCILLYKHHSYYLNEYITSIINDMPNAFHIVDAVAVLLKA